MGFRFRRSVRLLPGIRLNFGMRGVSTSLGGRGFTLNFGKRGIRTTVGIPGTGISYSEMLTGNTASDLGVAKATPPATGSSVGCGTLLVIVSGVFVVARLVGGPMDTRNSEAVASSAPASGVMTLPTATVTAKALKCRAAPNSHAQVLRRLLRDTTVQRLNEQAGWVQISGETAGGTAAESCWVAKRFLHYT